MARKCSYFVAHTHIAAAETDRGLDADQGFAFTEHTYTEGETEGCRQMHADQDGEQSYGWIRQIKRRQQKLQQHWNDFRLHQLTHFGMQTLSPCITSTSTHIHRRMQPHTGSKHDNVCKTFHLKFQTSAHKHNKTDIQTPFPTVKLIIESAACTHISNPFPCNADLKQGGQSVRT